MEKEWKKEYDDRIAEFRKAFILKAEPALTQCGFQYIEKYDAFIRNNSNEEVISFHITRKHGFYFQIHLFLELFNESIGASVQDLRDLDMTHELHMILISPVIEKAKNDIYKLLSID